MSALLLLKEGVTLPNSENDVVFFVACHPEHIDTNPEPGIQQDDIIKLGTFLGIDIFTIMDNVHSFFSTSDEEKMNTLVEAYRNSPLANGIADIRETE